MSARARVPALAALAACAAAALAPRAAAQRPAIDACAAQAIAYYAAHGAVARELGRAFLGDHESAVIEHRLEREGCVSLVAIGGAGLRDVDLLAHTARGEVLEEDVLPRAFGAVRACAAAATPIVAIAHAAAGRGEVRVLIVDSGEASALDPGRELGGCFARSAGARLARADVGPEPSGPPLERALASAQRRARELGWSSGEVRRGFLPPGGRDAERVVLAGGECHRVEAIAGPGVRALGLALIDPGGDVVATTERTRARDAALEVCPPEGGGWIAQVRARSGGGEHALVVRRLEGEPLAEARADPRARIESVELGARLTARGMRGRAIAWGLADRGLGQRFEVRAPGGCVAVAALRSSELAAGDLDVRVEDEGGRLLSWDEGPASSDRGAIPIAWSCAGGARTLSIRVRAHAGAGRFLLVLGEEGAR